MLFDENIECWRAGNNLPSNNNLCSMVGEWGRHKVKMGLPPPAYIQYKHDHYISRIFTSHRS